jgi:hypothetical protein
MATTRRAPRTRTPLTISDADLEQLLALSSGSDSVELKLTVPDDAQRSAIEALGLDPLDAQIRLVCFFDTPELTLNRAGVIVRARRVQGREDDSVIKLRPVAPDQLPDELRRSPGMVVELDAMPGGYVCSATLKNRLGETDVKRRVRGKRRTSKLFSKAQRAFYAGRARPRRPHAARPDLRAQAQLAAAGFKRKLTTELWMYPDGSHILELSTKCIPSEMFRAAAVLPKSRDWLRLLHCRCSFGQS